jgi:hypothetical protein
LAGKDGRAIKISSPRTLGDGEKLPPSQEKVLASTRGFDLTTEVEKTVSGLARMLSRSESEDIVRKNTTTIVMGRERDMNE